MTDYEWTAEEMSAYFRRIGLPQPEPEAAERLRLKAVQVSAAGRAIPRMDRKDAEPAPALRFPV